MTDGLQTLEACGPFFAVERHKPGASPVAPWRPIRDLVDGDDALGDRIAAVRSVLATSARISAESVELRVAGSVMQLGVVARLLSPVLGFAAAVGRQLVFDVDSWWWQPEPGGAFPLSLPSTAFVAGPTDAGGGVRALDEVIAAIVAETRAACGVSQALLWGNVASAINGAARMVASTRPDLSDAVYAQAASVAQRLRLHRSSTGPFGPEFRRRSCCLIYRTASSTPQAICGDCVFT
ncbi:FhuF-like iron-sulfur protein [Antricoccus suffuscus]|uniref:FhuF-like iron-sulfur protein n=1 Tax=Antricoccus suffuscus TaxID=1629062 RepID=A0A2T0ZZL4_9ACTN|nr:(2Fe-2S)-binding protein [Antricoccus suffuscus]PRZ41724.1 FhuF-like iron-sulfur protein [Antricoccus suffuscus]